MILRAWREGDDAEIVALLQRSFSDGWGDMAKWRRLHRDRPGFASDDVVLAELDGRLVGCLHTARCAISLGNGVSLPAAIDGDLAVDPAQRSLGIPEALYRRSSELLAARGIVIRQGYSESAVREPFYTRVLGYSGGFDRTEAWIKHLEPEPAVERIRARLTASAPAHPAERGPVVEIRLTDLPPLQLRLGRTGAEIVTGQRPDLAFRAPQAILSWASGKGPRPGWLHLLAQAARGRIAILPVSLSAGLCLLRLLAYGLPRIR